MGDFSRYLKAGLKWVNSCAKGHDLSACRRFDSVPAGQALSLRARQAGTLRSTNVRLWLTFSSAADDASVRGGDHFLESGQGLALAAGQAVVLQAWSAGVAASFAWEPAHSARPRRAGLRQSGTNAGMAAGKEFRIA